MREPLSEVVKPLAFNRPKHDRMDWSLTLEAINGSAAVREEVEAAAKEVEARHLSTASRALGALEAAIARIETAQASTRLWEDTERNAEARMLHAASGARALEDALTAKFINAPRSSTSEVASLIEEALDHARRVLEDTIR